MRLNTKILQDILHTPIRVDYPITGVSIDSRTIEVGNIFIAIKGTNTDGHSYLEQAAKAGASYLIVNPLVYKPSDCIDEDRIIKVEDTLKAFWEIAKWYRKTFNPLVIAITGSIGKTTVKETVANLISIKEPTLSSQASFNNHIGVPLTLAKLDPSIHFLVLEMGMNHPHELEQLSLLAEPDIAYINNVYPTHLEFMSSLENIIDAKLEIVSGLKGRLYINGDQEGLLNAARKIYSNIKTFGFDEGNDIQGVWDKASSSLDVLNKLTCSITSYRIDCLAKPQVYNILGSISIAMELGLNSDEISSGLSAKRDVEGRLNTQKTKDNIIIINDTYNASPYSVRLAFEVLVDCKWGKGRRIAVLGDMLELGNDSAFWHKQVGIWARELGINLLYVTGNNAMDYITDWQNGFGKYFEDKERLINALNETVTEDDVILFKGSRAMNMEKVIDGFKNKRYA